jgi:hypothetical protein
LDFVHAEAGPVFLVCDDYWSGGVTHGFHHFQGHWILAHVYLLVVNLVALQHALGAVALNTSWQCVNGNRHWSPSSFLWAAKSPFLAKICEISGEFQNYDFSTEPLDVVTKLGKIHLFSCFLEH